MKVRLSRRAARDFEALPPQIKARTAKQFDLLRVNLRHPSLRAKKYDESRGIWQGRVTRDWRFYVSIQDDTYEILTIIPHPK